VIQPSIEVNERLARSDCPDFNEPNKLGEWQAMVQELLRGRTRLVGRRRTEARLPHHPPGRTFARSEVGAELGVRVRRYFLQRMTTKWDGCNHRAGTIRLKT
jgi:hypothetical protein